MLFRKNATIVAVNAGIDYSNWWFTGGDPDYPRLEQMVGYGGNHITDNLPSYTTIIYLSTTQSSIFYKTPHSFEQINERTSFEKIWDHYEFQLSIYLKFFSNFTSNNLFLSQGITLYLILT